MNVNDILREEVKVQQQQAALAAHNGRQRLIAGMTAVIAVEGNAPICGGEIHIVTEGHGDPKAHPARFAENAEFVRKIERAGIGGRIQLGEGTRTYVVELVEIKDQTIQ